MALLRAQGLHLCWKIKHAKASLVLEEIGAAGCLPSQMFFLQNTAVLCLPTAWRVMIQAMASHYWGERLLTLAKFLSRTLWTFKQYKWSFAGAWTNALSLFSLQGEVQTIAWPTSAVPADWALGASASRLGSSWEDCAAELCRTFWNSTLAGQHITQVKPGLM